MTFPYGGKYKLTRLRKKWDVIQCWQVKSVEFQGIFCHYLTSKVPPTVCASLHAFFPTHSSFPSHGEKINKWVHWKICVIRYLWRSAILNPVSIHSSKFHFTCMDPNWKCHSFPILFQHHNPNSLLKWIQKLAVWRCEQPPLALRCRFWSL